MVNLMVYKDFKSALMEIHRLKSSSNGEIKKREALELACKSLKQENERLTKLYTESLNNVVDQLEHRTTCQSLKERLKRMNDGCLSKEDERRKFESIKQEYAKKISDLETQIKGLVLEKATNEATLNQLRQDLGAHKSHIQYLAGRLERVHLNVESKYELEIQGLRDCITNEKEEKKELNNKLQHLEKELLICRSKIVKQQQHFTSDVHNATLQKTNVESRKEHKILKRRLIESERE